MHSNSWSLCTSLMSKPHQAYAAISFLMTRRIVALDLFATTTQDRKPILQEIK